jgi:predicted DNA-binding transcriptional regulator YafY
MFDSQTKFKRQIEILGLCNADHLECTNEFLFDEYNVEPLTIKRDLQELRSYGIDIHSSGKRGVELLKAPEPDKLKELLIQYLGLCYSLNSYDKPVALMIKKLKHKALSNVVILQKSIEKRKMLSILYEKEASEKETSWRDICPLQMFQSENFWRVLAVHNGMMKQFHLNKILDIKQLNKSFKPVHQKEIDELFLYSWKSWLGLEKFQVKLKLSKQWVEKIKPRQVMIYQDITGHDDGSVDFKITVNTLEEIAGWIVSRGEGVTVLEPPELKEKVIRLAKGTLSNYQPAGDK